MYELSLMLHHEFVHLLQNHVTQKAQGGRFPLSTAVRSTPNSLPSLNYPH